MLSLILIITASLFFTGIILRTKSIAAGRKGPGILQPLRDVERLLRKGSVYSTTTSVIFRMAPSVNLAAVLMAATLIPVGQTKGLFSFNGDFVFFAYLLAMGRFFSIIAALDTGSSFEGMGAGREALFSLLLEPAFFIILGSLALLSGYTSFYEIFRVLHIGSWVTYAIAAMATFVLLMIAMTENSRMPVDDPATHLELTMIHEVMILDNSGFDLALIHITGFLKFAIFGALIVNLFTGMVSYGLAIPLFFTVQFLMAVTIGLTESFMARFRMNHNPQFIFALTSVSILVFFGALLISGKFI